MYAENHARIILSRQLTRVVVGRVVAGQLETEHIVTQLCHPPLASPKIKLDRR